MVVAAAAAVAAAPLAVRMAAPKRLSSAKLPTPYCECTPIDEPIKFVGLPVSLFDVCIGSGLDAIRFFFFFFFVVAGGSPSSDVFTNNADLSCIVFSLDRRRASRCAGDIAVAAMGAALAALAVIVAAAAGGIVVVIIDRLVASVAAFADCFGRANFLDTFTVSAAVVLAALIVLLLNFVLLLLKIELTSTDILLYFVDGF